MDMLLWHVLKMMLTIMVKNRYSYLCNFIPICCTSWLILTYSLLTEHYSEVGSRPSLYLDGHGLKSQTTDWQLWLTLLAVLSDPSRKILGHNLKFGQSLSHAMSFPVCYSLTHLPFIIIQYEWMCHLLNHKSMLQYILINWSISPDGFIRHWIKKLIESVSIRKSIEFSEITKIKHQKL